MAYDPITGEYKEEDTSVSKRIQGLLSKDSPYMKQAETQGLQSANRRGLLNSSIAVGAAQESRVRAALPIASQEAAQAHESNVTGRGYQMQDVTQQRDITSREKMQGLDLASRERINTADIAASKERLGMQLTSQEKLALQDIQSRERMQGIDIEAQNQRLEAELGSREALQAAQIAADKERLGMQLSSQEQLALQELNAAKERLGMQLESNQELAVLDANLRERLTAMDLSSGDLRTAASLASSFESAYSNMIAGIMANPDIPAAERQRYMDHVNSLRESNLNLLEQFFSVSLDWGTSGLTYDNVSSPSPSTFDRLANYTRENAV